MNSGEYQFVRSEHQILVATFLVTFTLNQPQIYQKIILSPNQLSEY